METWEQSDPDGAAIKNLLLTFLWWICPELVENGHVWVTIPPLFRITTSKNEYIYLRDEKELEEYKKANKGAKFLINRNKGLGEQNSEELEEGLLNVKTRNVQQITVKNAEETENLFEVLMGKTVAERKEYLLNHLEEAQEL